MGERLKERLKQRSFSSAYQEAMLGVLVTADRLSRVMEETCERHGITAAQYNVLRILRGVYPGGHPRCEIITRMISAAPDVTRLIDRLEKMGLAERRKSEDDRRLSLTVITAKGLHVLEAMQPEVEAVNERIAATLSLAEAKKLAELCDKLVAAATD
jgi:DNA-binding MarR family transcriptional regulator